MKEDYVILVAVHVTAEDRAGAHEAVLNFMPGVRGLPVESGIECWWVAEDDRTDRSDCDSAIFVPRGAQDDMRDVLDMYFDAHAEEWREDGYPYADTDVTSWFRQ